ncbi:MAG: Zn-ribbon domain-containing OB-fold protein [Candidatus Rokubacteria bacterium]|nr:Zn-ribbon domain-containing OB-fold protein [Candidatus Rokubacteria bacterium]
MTEPVLRLREFFDHAREGTLTAIRCGKCGELAIPPKEFCPACQQRAWESATLSGEGAIASFTIIRVAPARHVSEAPYAIAVVRMKEGVNLTGRIVDIPFDRLQVGLPVRFRPLVSEGNTTLGFGPA